MTTSIVLYGSGIWGPIITSKKLNQYRLLSSNGFQLPRYTPGYALRSEKGPSTLEYAVAKRTLQLWINILNANPTRYIRRIYEKLRECIETQISDETAQNLKLNWVNQLKLLLQRSKHEYLIECNDLKSIKLAVPVMEGALRYISFIEDCKRSMDSSFPPLYRDLLSTDSPTIRLYLMLTLPLNYIRM